jgi:PEP-CTERM motif-containing protein
MHLRTALPVATIAMLSWAAPTPATAIPFFFSTGDPDGKIATATRPDVGGAFEIESADDFVLQLPTSLTGASFTGLFASPSTGAPTDVVVEIYRVFPADSDTSRTSGPPTFSTPQVPTRVNSPSDVALDSRDSAANQLTFTTSALGTFTASNSVQPGGIHPKPGQNTGGDGAVTGEEIQFTVSFTDPFVLAPGHYFFVPQVALDTGNFLWLSAPKPIVPPGTPFPPGFTDLQSWTRDEALAPDWLRVGTDIVGGNPFPTFNAAFSLTGDAVPEPGTLALLVTGLLGLFLLRRSRSSLRRGVFR